MGVLFESVQPGDLIASDLFNRLLAEFDKLRNRVAVLEGTPSVGDVAIIRLVPDSGAVRPGDFLQVLGYGFGLSLGACRAFIDGVEIAQFQPGSNDGQLILIVPDGVGVALPIPPAGRPGALVVRGPKGTARRDGCPNAPHRFDEGRRTADAEDRFGEPRHRHERAILTRSTRTNGEAPWRSDSVMFPQVRQLLFERARELRRKNFLTCLSGARIERFAGCRAQQRAWFARG